DRAVGAVSQDRLQQMLSRAKRSAQAGNAAAPPGRAAAQLTSARGRPRTFADEPAEPTAHVAPVMRGQSPENPMPGTFAPPSPMPPDMPLPAERSHDPLITSHPSVPQGPHREALTAAGTALATNTQAAERCLASSVRLKIADAEGNSVGSGTIIDARAGEALVLTCGHVFRDSQGKGKILVDMFGPGAPKGVAGQVIGYDLKRDVGLVSFRPGVPVTVARLAPHDYQVKPGDPVLSIGCDNGREPSVRNSHVTSTDKFLPPPNIQVAGQPVEGRSGGGLFTSSGLLIGVCNAADPTDNQGLYAAIGSIHSELARKGLTGMLAQPAPPPPAVMEPLSMAKNMPATDMRSSAPRVVPTSSEDPRGPVGGAQLSASERSVLEKIRASAGDAEVVCIVRPLTDPHSMSEIVVIDRASQDLLRQLASERRAAPPQPPTSLPPQPAGSPAAQPPRADIMGAASNWQQPTTRLR
ncbi:MAG: serine protease, partial [Singulisphaera sp.]